MDKARLHDMLVTAVRDVARDYNALQEPVMLKLKGDRDQVRVPPTSMRVCPKGCHLAVAHRWERRCDGCGQDIAAGAIGLHTHFETTDQPRCIGGHYRFQCFCGTLMPPTEHIVGLEYDAVEGLLPDPASSAYRQAYIDGLDVHKEINDDIDKLAERIVKRALAELMDQVDDEQQREVEEIRQRLLDNLRSTLELIDQGYSVEDLDLTHPLDPGVHYEDGEFDAWDIDPRDGDPIVVTPADLDNNGASDGSQT
jgi:DNA-binding protein YbaB